ncbi:MAG: hypothetical protein M3N14_06840 [Bacteroidota bacterium]|nr:hypothetical protein [Bacteroidota bacterium]
MEKSSRKLLLFFVLITSTVGYKICKDILKSGVRDGKQTQLKQAVQQKK